MQLFTRFLFAVLFPVFVVVLLLSVLGFDSISEMIKSLVENTIPFGNVVAKVMDSYQAITIGKTLTVTMIVNDILKTVISGFLFTFAMRFVNFFIKITSRNPIIYFFTECLVSILLAVVSGFILQHLHNFLSTTIGNIGSFVAQLAIAVILGILWFGIMRAGGGLITNQAIWMFMLTRKIIPTALRTISSFVLVSIILIVISSRELSSSILPVIIVIYGLLMLFSSIFEKGSILF